MEKGLKKKAIATICCCLIITIVSATAGLKISLAADGTVKDGTYSIPVSLWKALEDKASMGNSALQQTGKLVVKDGKAKLYLKFISMEFAGMSGYLMQLNLLEDIAFNEFGYPENYTKLPSEVVSTYGIVDRYNEETSEDKVCAGKMYPKVVSVPITMEQEYIWAHVYVPVMGELDSGDQECRIKLDFSNMKEMTQAELDAWAEAEKSDPKQETDPGKLDKDNLPNGKYNVQVALWHATSNKASMGNPTLNSKALLTVQNGSYTMDVSTHPMTVGTITACLQTLQIRQADGSYKYAQITAKNNPNGQPSVFRFVLPSKEEYIQVKIDPKVEVMGEDPLPARLKISWDTLTKASDDATVEENNKTVAAGLDTEAVDITDKKTKVRIKASKNVLVNGVKLKVTQLKSGSKYNKVKKALSGIGDKITVYDITLYSPENSKVQPNGMVKVYLPIPDGYNKKKLQVYRVSGSTKTKMSAKAGSRNCTFSSNHFSIYALVDISGGTGSSSSVSSGGSVLPEGDSSTLLEDTALPEDTLTEAGVETDPQITQSSIPYTGSALSTEKMMALMLLGISMLSSFVLVVTVIVFFIKMAGRRRT